RRRGMRTSLTGRIVLVTFAVALIAVLVTAVVSLQVVQGVAQNQARQQLRAQATTLIAEAGTTPKRLDRLAQRVASLGDRFALVAPDGTITGGARASVSGAVVRELQAGKTVSTTTTLAGKDAVLIGIPTRNGGGIVGVRKVADIAAANAELIGWIIAALAIGLVAAMVAGAFLARWIAGPLTRLAGSARSLAGGQRGVPIEEQRIDQIEDIARALRSLDAALAASEDRQREFLLSVSHDLRTPLTAIRGYAEALADGVIPPGDVAGVGATLSVEAERLRRFVDDLLELARLQAEDFPITLQEVDARETVRRAEQAWAGASLRVGVGLRSELPDTPLRIRTDELRLRQVLDGLIENALRVTPEGSPVVLAGREGDGGVTLEVRDGGPGLSAEDMDVAFERGTLHGRYRDIRPVGTGLGLSIARRLVERLGGTITVSVAPEGGASFRVTIPYIPPTVPAPGADAGM
ncbi:MAG TPA: HAMP domain-containing sensor histidine kinase, partial [Leifsonia sp.]